MFLHEEIIQAVDAAIPDVDSADRLAVCNAVLPLLDRARAAGCQEAKAVEIQKLELKPGDVVVFTMPSEKDMNTGIAHEIRQQLARLGHEFLKMPTVVLPHGLTVKEMPEPDATALAKEQPGA